MLLLLNIGNYKLQGRVNVQWRSVTKFHEHFYIESVQNTQLDPSSLLLLPQDINVGLLRKSYYVAV
jgi:hypothetical protein